MLKIVCPESIKTFLVGFLVGTVRGGPLHKLYNTVSDKAPYLVDASFGKGKGLQAVVDCGMKVTEGVEQSAVKVKNYCFIYGYQSFAIL